MTVLIAGASGATGRLLTEQLVERGHTVRIIVRRTDSLPDEILNHENITVIRASILDLSDQELAEHAKGCDALASCLGHNISFEGMFGKPRRLVTEAVSRLCRAVQTNSPEKPVKFVLMSTTGYRNPDNPEHHSTGEKLVLGLIRLLLPPMPDNEQAAEFLRTQIGQDDRIIQWTAVRPDSLIDEKETSPLEVHPSPVRSAIFDPGKTSRINVAYFMAELIENEETWNSWKGQTPVIYNK
jgi:nucleoside-diphosphate-sugar epimerase